MTGADAPAVEQQLRHLANQLDQCGGFLGFKHFFTIDELRLHVGYFCQRDKLCGLCAIRRASKLLRSYSEKFAQIATERADLTGGMITFTIAGREDLSDGLRHLLSSHSMLLDRRKKYLASPGKRPFTQAARAAGGVARVEIKRGSGSGLWHPHIHAAWLCDRLPSEDQLRREWREITGDSHQVKVSPLHVDGITPEAFAGGLVEVLKYAVKLSDTDVADAYHAHCVTAGKKLVRPFGILHGVEVPPGCLDDPLTDSDLPYVELFFRYAGGKFVDACNSPY